MQRVPPYPHTSAAQMDWFRSFEQTMRDYMQRMRDQYTAYVANPISLQVTHSYSSMVDIMCSANDYLHESIAIVRAEEQAYPRIRHRAAMEFMMQRVFDMKMFKAEVDSMYYTLQEVYLRVTALPPLNEPLDPEKVHEWFCIH